MSNNFALFDTSNTARGTSDLWRLDTGLLVAGVSHHTSGVEVREKLSLVGQRYDDFMSSLTNCRGLQGAVVLTTCNRTEVIAAAHMQESLQKTTTDIAELWCSTAGIKHEQFHKQEYRLSQHDAVRHVFRVAAGLDSLILGEPQVLGQLKKAYRSSCELGLTGHLLERLFQQAFAVAKRIRAETNISRLPVSVAYAARVLCEHIFGEVSSARVLLVGAGETAALMMRHLRQAGCQNFCVANRTLAKAELLAQEFNARAVTLEQLPAELGVADIVITAATVEQESLLLEFDDFARAAESRPGHMQLCIDLAIPRNVDSRVADLPDVFLYNVDDLESVVQSNSKQRRAAAKEAECIVGEQALQFVEWVNSRHVHETIRDARQRIKCFEEVELEKSVRRLRRLGYSDEQCRELLLVLQDYSDGVLSKVLHQPFSKVREAGEDEKAHHINRFSEYFLDDFSQQPYRSDLTQRKVGNSNK